MLLFKFSERTGASTGPPPLVPIPKLLIPKTGSFQGYEQDYFVDALQQLGKQFVGITQLPLDTTNKELQRLNDIGIRGIRFNLYRGLNHTLEEIKAMSLRCYNLYGWTTFILEHHAPKPNSALP